MISNAKRDAQKYLGLLRGKIQKQHEPLRKIIFSFYFKSLIIYFFTPVCAAGIVNRNDIKMYEASLKEKNLLLPIDI